MLFKEENARFVIISLVSVNVDLVVAHIQIGARIKK